MDNKHTKSKWYKSTASETVPNTQRQTVPTGLPLPPSASVNRSKPSRHEPSRTTKTAPKTILLPSESEPISALSGLPIDAVVEDLHSAEPTREPQTTPSLPIIMYEEDATMNDNLKRVSAWLVSESINLRAVMEHLTKQSKCDPKRFDEVVYTPYPAQSQVPEYPGQSVNTDVFLFEYGVVVMWGLTEEEERCLLTAYSKFYVDKLSPEDMDIEQFHYGFDDTRPPRLHNDTIWLKHPQVNHHQGSQPKNKQSLMVELTISHALAQSVKLTRFEGVVEGTIITTKDIPYALASTGTIAMSRQAITKQIGELLITRINVNLVSNVLDAPEIFWSEPAFVPLYQTVRTYLEINQRVDVLNQRCEVISEMLDLLRDHANSMHAEYLEWIIIVLITIEILLGLFEVGMHIVGRL